MKTFFGFRARSNQAELMDDLSLEGPMLRQALNDIKLVNRVLGGHAVTMLGLRPFLNAKGINPITILDMGCGDGEFLRYLAGHCRDEDIEVQLLGWDRNPLSLKSAKELSSGMTEIRFEQQNILENPKLPTGDLIIMCNLFLHHFSDDQIRGMLEHWLRGGCRAIVINDLHRNLFAYYLFRLFGITFMKSRIARHDGLVSIKRGFRRNDLERFSKQLGLKNFKIRWKWAFRYLWVMTLNEKS